MFDSINVEVTTEKASFTSGADVLVARFNDAGELVPVWYCGTLGKFSELARALAKFKNDALATGIIVEHAPA